MILLDDPEDYSAVMLSAWGANFLLLLFVGSSVYVGGGVYVNVRRHGAALGPEALPHQAFWRSVAGLVLDGVSYSKPLVASGVHQLRARVSGRQGAPSGDSSGGGGGGGGGSAGGLEDILFSVGEFGDMRGDNTFVGSGGGGNELEEDEAEGGILE
jgi:uncharacterized membrane protein YgcG